MSAANPARPDWRNFLATDRRWLFPDVGYHEAAGRPDNDTQLDGFAAIAAYLEIDASALENNADRLRLPFLAIVEHPRVAGPGRFVRHWESLARFRAYHREAPVCSTAFALSLWIALNSPFRPDEIQSRVPGSR